MNPNRPSGLFLILLITSAASSALIGWFFLSAIWLELAK